MAFQNLFVLNANNKLKIQKDERILAKNPRIN